MAFELAYDWMGYGETCLTIFTNDEGEWTHTEWSGDQDVFVGYNGKSIITVDVIESEDSTDVLVTYSKHECGIKWLDSSIPGTGADRGEDVVTKINQLIEELLPT